MATNQPTSLNITIGNNPPVIVYIYMPASVDPVDASDVNVTFSFLAMDQDGISQFNNNSAAANFTLDAAGLGNGMMINSSGCTPDESGNNATTQNFSCSVIMRYWDRASDWSVNASISDSASQSTPYNQTFTYNSLTAINMTPSSMGWGAVTLASIDQLSTSNPLIVGNTGNYNITNMNVSAIDLGGEQTQSEFISASNFSVNVNNACNGGNVLQNQTAGDVIISGGGIATGLEKGEAASDELMYLCLEELPQLISQQSYSTVNVGSWTVGVV